MLRPDAAGVPPAAVPEGAYSARLPLEALLPPTGRPAVATKRTKDHASAMQMQVVLTALGYHSVCGGCWATALAASLPPSKQVPILRGKCVGTSDPKQG